ncbi:2,4-dihydroxyhept-2-enedioate aldolase [Paraburkholderia sp. BL27I4N3]|uniref:HpcH/HpaI aldolase family protein n=1 Tax=Paraburkholderia sp. BL27I4N3 TaxID=1938805 RepID=UPI000E237818|nr:HpcH/HpaI aldolase/citrate lyase family protein [Paraburkholderia sp. BL27I4N3]REE07414.1 2,4-dihydroxyhept-2-enedioate aldolase [Paraburkholderia sp. BL27I4N3]
MDLPVNHFKRAILARESQIGIWVALGNPYSTELVAASGFDWLLLDGEHGPNDTLLIGAQLQAAAPYCSHSVARPPSGDDVTIKRYLDLGAQTLLIPMVETAEQARSIVAATRYAPDGVRGIATMTRAARWTRIPDYLKRAHEQLCVIPQIESVRGLENLEEIAAVPGVDALFIGPADLSASMGYIGGAGHPDVLAEVERAIARIVAAGKPAGILTVDETLAQRYLDLGCSFVAVGVDTIILAKAVDALRARFPSRNAAG